VLSFSEGFPQGQHATADPRPRFEDRNLVPGRLESVPGYETGKPGSDNESLHEIVPSLQQ
jgi:hypothetical protein